MFTLIRVLFQSLPISVVDDSFGIDTKKVIKAKYSETLCLFKCKRCVMVAKNAASCHVIHVSTDIS